jgi:hypothetical protein
MFVQRQKDFVGKKPGERIDVDKEHAEKFIELVVAPCQGEHSPRLVCRGLCVPSMNKADANVRQVRRKAPKTLRKLGLSELYQLIKLTLVAS